MVIEGLSLKLKLTLLVLLVVSVEVLRVEFLPESPVFLLQGYLLAHQYLDVLLHRFGIAQLLQQVLDLLVLKRHALVSCVDLDLGLFNLF